MRALEEIERNSIWVLLPLLFLLLGVALGVISMSTVAGCATLRLEHSSDPYLLAAIAGVGLVSGRALGTLRSWMHYDPSPVSDGVTTQPWVQGLLVVLLTVASAALVYESLGTYPTTNARPITDYIRCAAANHFWITGGTSYLVFLLVGSWLWYPVSSGARTRDEDRDEPPPLTSPENQSAGPIVIDSAPR